MGKDKHNELCVGAYCPDECSEPVLVAVVMTPDGYPFVVGVPATRDGENYESLLDACQGKPIWLYGQEPVPLTDQRTTQEIMSEKILSGLRTILVRSGKKSRDYQKARAKLIEISVAKTYPQVVAKAKEFLALFT